LANILIHGKISFSPGNNLLLANALICEIRHIQSLNLHVRVSTAKFIYILRS